MKKISGTFFAGSLALTTAAAALMMLAPLSFAFAQASPSASITSLSPGTSVPVGTEVVFDVNTTGFSSSVSYAVNDSLSGSTVNSSDINGSGVFVWVPASNDVGVHTITVTATDQSGDTVSASQSITVTGAPAISVQSLSPGNTVTVGTPVFFTAVASGFTNPTYSVNDTSNGSSLNQGDINASGGFSWTPKAQDVGGHTITVSAHDNFGDNASASLNVSVSAGASASIGSLAPSANVTPGQTVTFTVVPSGFGTPSYTASDSFANSTVVTSDINSSGLFTWTPQASDAGSHLITVNVTDASGNNTNVSQAISVANAPAATTTTTAVAASSGLNQDEISAILSLLQSFGADQSTIASVSAALGGQTVATTAPSGFTFTQYLYPGVSSDQVTQLQNLLTSLGFFSGTATGYYGNLTEAAVDKYQAAHGITQTGTVGPLTRAALN